MAGEYLLDLAELTARVRVQAPPSRQAGGATGWTDRPGLEAVPCVIGPGGMLRGEPQFRQAAQTDWEIQTNADLSAVRRGDRLVWQTPSGPRYLGVIDLWDVAEAGERWVVFANSQSA